MSEEFEHTGAGSSTTRPIQAGAVKKGAFCMLKDRPCRVVEVSTSKTGKHGHAKASIVGIDVFTGKKYDENCPTSHNMEEPIVTRTQYTIIHWEDGFLHLLDAAGNLRQDLAWPEGREDKTLDEWRKQIEAGGNVMCTVIKACGEEKVLGPNEK